MTKGVTLSVTEHGARMTGRAPPYRTVITGSLRAPDTDEPPYSDRRAATGSTRAARDTGIQHIAATTATLLDESGSDSAATKPSVDPPGQRVA